MPSNLFPEDNPGPSPAGLSYCGLEAIGLLQQFVQTVE